MISAGQARTERNAIATAIATRGPGPGLQPAGPHRPARPAHRLRLLEPAPRQRTTPTPPGPRRAAGTTRATSRGRGRGDVRHFLDIDRAVVLPTGQLAMVEHAVGDLVTRQAMGAVHGPAGLGKTFAVEQALARGGGAPVGRLLGDVPQAHDAAGRGHAVRRADPGPRRARDRFVLAELLEELAPPPGRTRAPGRSGRGPAAQPRVHRVPALPARPPADPVRVAAGRRGRHLAGAVPRADAALADLPPGGLRTAVRRAGVRVLPAITRSTPAPARTCCCSSMTTSRTATCGTGLRSPPPP